MPATAWGCGNYPIKKRAVDIHRGQYSPMVNPEFFDESISVTSSVDAHGHTTLQSFSWRDTTYPIVAVGRQWDEADGRHMLVEAVDGTRFELQLRREDLVWHVRKVWRGQIIA